MQWIKAEIFDFLIYNFIACLIKMIYYQSQYMIKENFIF